MKFIRYKYKDKIRNGIQIKNKVIDMSLINKKYDSFINLVSLNDEEIEKLKSRAYLLKDKYIDLEDVIILSPIERTVNDIMCIGLNYHKHIEESGEIIGDAEYIDENPVYFSKRANIINGPNSEIFVHSHMDENIDYEVELAVIIGKKGINIDEDKAMDHIFGYTILNDLTSRHIQKKYGQWFKGKSLDGYISIGPAIVHKSEIREPLELDIGTRVNGEIRQSSNTRKMIRDVKKLISEISQGMTLVPGDIISTGTPEGVGMGFNPYKYLKDGDIIECEIENIGILRNKIVNPKY